MILSLALELNPLYRGRTIAVCHGRNCVHRPALHLTQLSILQRNSALTHPRHCQLSLAASSFFFPSINPCCVQTSSLLSVGREGNFYNTKQDIIITLQLKVKKMDEQQRKAFTKCLYRSRGRGRRSRRTVGPAWMWKVLYQ